MTPYVFQRGETILLALDAVTGDPLSVTAISAGMKAVAPGRTSTSNGSPLAAAFAVVPRAAQGDIPPGWNLTIDAATSAGLAAGNYLADAKITIGGGVVITDSVAIALRESVSA